MRSVLAAALATVVLAVIVSSRVTAAEKKDGAGGNGPAATDKDKPSDKASEHPQVGDSTDTPAAKHSPKEEEEFYELYKALADTVDQVDRNYVKKVDRRELMEAAIKGVLTKLDPYSSYIGRGEASQFKDTVENQFAGIGVSITVDDGQLKVLSPLVGTPGYKAGLLPGDRILKIDGEATGELDVEEAVHKLKGAPGSRVTLSVQHPGAKEPHNVSVTREVIHIDTVLGDHRKADDTWDYMLDADKHIGYVRVTTFSRDTAQDLKKVLEDMRRRKLRGLVIDLRFNPGGLLTTAIDTCDMFLSEGRIVSTEGRNTPKRVWDATKKTDAFAGFPIAVLVNHYSASASEIVAACLQDHGKAIIIGDRTWGKGSVQNVIELEDGKSLLKLTTASYQRPNGHNIHRFPDAKETDEWGVSPNPGYELKLSDSEIAELLLERRRRDMVAGKHEDKPSEKTPDTKPEASAVAKHDRQLQKAIDYLTTELAKAQ